MPKKKALSKFCTNEKWGWIISNHIEQKERVVLIDREKNNWSSKK